MHRGKSETIENLIDLIFFFISRTYPMVDASTQYQILNEKMHRSTQTDDDYHHELPLQQYSEHSVGL